MATSRATVVPMKMAQMKVAQVSNPGADFRIVEREIPEPDAGHVRIKVQAGTAARTAPDANAGAGIFATAGT